MTKTISGHTQHSASFSLLTTRSTALSVEGPQLLCATKREDSLVQVWIFLTYTNMYCRRCIDLIMAMATPAVLRFLTFTISADLNPAAGSLIGTDSNTELNYPSCSAGFGRLAPTSLLAVRVLGGKLSADPRVSDGRTCGGTCHVTDVNASPTVNHMSCLAELTACL